MYQTIYEEKGIMYQTKLDLTNMHLSLYPIKILFNDSSYMQTNVCELRKKKTNKCIIAGTHYQDQVQ
jgi:hypothetical protein